MDFPFKPPFKTVNGVIRDAENREVRLWGVNYYAPFSHNYVNIQQVGKDHRACIDEDIADFKRLGIDFVRMHLYEREITDREGNVVENHQMQVFDYLVEKLRDAGIFLMVTPITWWNSPVFQARIEWAYAYWHTGSDAAFGFTNFYGKDAMLWHPGALECQERYLGQLFSRASTVTGKKLAQHENVIALEIINEPTYIHPGLLDEGAPRSGHLWELVYSAPKDRGPLREAWKAFRDGHPGEERAVFEEFRAQILARYLKRMYAAIGAHLDRPILRTHIQQEYWAHVGWEKEEALARAISESSLDAVTIGSYLNGEGDFDSSSTAHLDYFKMLMDSYPADKMKRLQIPGLAKIVYEYDATGSERGYPFAAMAKAFAVLGVQMAAMFTYTPAAVAEYNPGWLVHFMNLRHTPHKAMALAAAGALFRGEKLGGALPTDRDAWHGNGWEIDGKKDTIGVRGGKSLRHVGLLPQGHPALAGEAPEEILGTGSTPFAASEGNGIFHLRKISQREWELHLEPCQKTVADPLRGRSYKAMANRYMDVNVVPPVSRLLDQEWNFRLTHPALPRFTCHRLKDGVEIPIPVKDGAFAVRAGTYFLKAEE